MFGGKYTRDSLQSPERESSKRGPRVLPVLSSVRFLVFSGTTYFFGRHVRVRVIDLALGVMVARRLLRGDQRGRNFARQAALVVSYFDAIDGLAGCASRCVVQSGRDGLHGAGSTYFEKRENSDEKEKREKEKPISLTGSIHLD